MTPEDAAVYADLVRQAAQRDVRVSVLSEPGQPIEFLIRAPHGLFTVADGWLALRTILQRMGVKQ